MASWKPKTVPTGTPVPVWSKSFASTLRGSEERSEQCDSFCVGKSNMQSIENDRIQPMESLYHHFRQSPTQVCSGSTSSSILDLDYFFFQFSLELLYSDQPT